DDAERAVAVGALTYDEALEALAARNHRRRMPQANYLTSVASDGIGTYGRTLGGKVNSIGEYRIPVILVQFPDRQFNATSTDEKYDRWLNAETYTDDGAAGSVRQYFVTQSKGLFTPNFEVVARVTLDSSYVRYGKDNGDSHDVNLFSVFIKEVFEKVKASGANMTQYQDSRTDNCIPLVAILYAGTGQAMSGQADDIWPCEMDLGPNYTSYTGGYRVNSVFFGNEWGYSKMNGLGTFCHEFGHALGLPDIYATTYSHSTPLTGYWDIMESGCYNDNGYRPIDYTAHEKNQLGWLRLTEPTEPHVYTLYPMSDDREPHALLLRNPENPAEYYIVENHQPGQWSGDNFGSGLLAMHIDYTASNWSGNNVNNDGTHPRTVVVPADNYLSSDASDLYPSGNNRILHDKSTPATKVYTGSGLGHPLYTIRSNKDGTVTFSYGSASAPAYFVGDTVSVASYHLTCLVSATRELTVVPTEGGYSGDVTIPNDSVYFDHTRYKFVGVSDNAFVGNDALTSVHIGNRVRNVAPGAFRATPALAAITASDDNTYYEAHDGALYTRRPTGEALEPADLTADIAGNPQGLPVSTSLRDYETGRFPLTYTDGGLTVTLADGDNPAILWESTVGTRLRMAKNATLTVSAPTGFDITGITFDANTLNLKPAQGAMGSRTWTGDPTPSVTFTATSANTIASITATVQRNADAIYLVAAPHTDGGTFAVPDSVTALAPYAFSGATYTAVSLPATVTEVGADALALPTLASLEVAALTPPACLADPFTGVPTDCVLHVAEASVTAYQGAAYWERFFGHIEGDLSTAIATPLLPAAHSAAPVYDLQGRRVATPQHGIYIQGGVKVVR
ncbi:MAG: M6 family metalloprotease domain-containing protein, partial [Bacteroidaceae bacterium]|nr:M6 family metalloprotease domain-containing protein [Bacteroidaceae bacterium]